MYVPGCEPGVQEQQQQLVHASLAHQTVLTKYIIMDQKRWCAFVNQLNELSAAKEIDLLSRYHRAHSTFALPKRLTLVKYNGEVIMYFQDEAMVILNFNGANCMMLGGRYESFGLDWLIKAHRKYKIQTLL